MNAKSWKGMTIRGLTPVLVWLAAAAAFGQTAISTDGAIESKSGGFKFPDGTVQTTAAEVADPCANSNDLADEMIRVGGVCIDKYEASVWSQPDGGIQYGVSGDDYPCSDNGQDCFDKIYARSVVGVQPSAFITWFQAVAALRNSDKRLPSNEEWQGAVQGTPDSSFVCNIDTGSVANTGSGCVSDWGTFDMVGNLAEWVADWVPRSTASCSSLYGGDSNFFCDDGDANSSGPGALIRGGTFQSGALAGPFAVSGIGQPSNSDSLVGFRGAR